MQEAGVVAKVEAQSLCRRLATTSDACVLCIGQERFKKIALAYECLSDARARKQHDEEIGVGQHLNMKTAFSYA